MARGEPFEKKFPAGFYPCRLDVVCIICHVFCIVTHYSVLFILLYTLCALKAYTLFAIYLFIKTYLYRVEHN